MLPRLAQVHARRPGNVCSTVTTSPHGGVEQARPRSPGVDLTHIRLCTLPTGAPTCVVACGRQQKAASTSPKLTSSILTSLGTLVAVMRCGNTSEKGCAGGAGRSPGECAQRVRVRGPFARHVGGGDGVRKHVHGAGRVWVKASQGKWAGVMECETTFRKDCRKDVWV